jgi:DNA-directed RNA polymerase specialized sigma24 family protein
MNVTSTPAADLAALYGRYSARLAAHAAERLAAAGADPVDEADDVTQEVWLWVAQQRRLPGWEGLRVMTDWAIEAAISEQQDRLEDLVGMRPSGTPVVPPLGIESVRPVRIEVAEAPEASSLSLSPAA